MASPYLISSTKKIFVLLIFLVLSAGQLLAQSNVAPFRISHDANSVSRTTLSDGTLHIVAAMVEFQPDTTRFTSGNGSFSDESIPYLQNESITIDPLPHNKAYFEAHLEFAKNYFLKMSSGNLNISYQVLDNVYRLPEKMAAYSPVGVNPASDPLADLARDAWTEVAESGNLDLGLNPGDQIAFALFHAGVGRDIELTGTTLDKTPQDIPSVYISSDAFSTLFDDPSFSGFPIDGGNLLVDNTLILPRTLTRAGVDITGSEVLLQLSTNGMVTAQIGSHIGLPDLFNTETGESGIGRFGLMDGAGIFAYNGLFPPEMSAWEKTYMGWANPFDVDYNAETPIILPASSLGQPSSIAKIPLSGREYFLVENRHREGTETGTTLTIRQPDGSTITQDFSNTDTTFVYQLSGFSDELPPGVVIDVSNYDFALPGGPAEVLNDTGQDIGRILNGGMLIWHIDEGIIQKRLSANRGVNDDPDQKGVNLMEADGAQDIGRPTAIGFFENEVNGSPFDFWWSGNNASVITPTQTITLYENLFGPDTTPNNDSNSGAESQFELFDFSDNIVNATFQIRPAESNEIYEIVDFVQNLPLSHSTPENDPYWSNYSLSTVIQQSTNGSYIYLPGSNGISVYDINQNSLLPPATLYNTFQQPFLNTESGILSVSPNPAQQSTIFSTTLLEVDPAGLTQGTQFSLPANLGLIGSPETDILQFDGTADRLRLSSEILEPDFYSVAGYRSAQVRGYKTSLANNGAIEFTTPTNDYVGSILMPDTNYGRVHIGLFEIPDGRFKPYVISENTLYVLDLTTDGDIQPRSLHSSGGIEWPALADINQSGEIDFLFVDKDTNQLIAKNTNGAVLNGFPIDPPDGTIFKGSPLISDLNGDETLNILIAARTSESLNIYAYNANGEQLDGFPLLVGGYLDESNEIVNPSMNETLLAAVSPDGDFKVWNFPEAQSTLWESRYGNGGTNKLTGRLVDAATQEPAFSVLNKDETYNWPNPASEETFIRFQTSNPGSVQIRISTTSGRLIYNQTHESRGGSPEEIRIDTSGWGSGGYLALIEANVNGNTERKLVKIAVAR